MTWMSGESDAEAQKSREDNFAKLWSGLWADLSKTFWPSEIARPDVVRTWPLTPPLKEYRIFQDLIRRECNRQLALGFGPWLKIESYECYAILKLQPLNKQ